MNTKAKALELWAAGDDLEAIIHEGQMVIDPTLASRILSERVYSGQRPLQKVSAALWAKMIASGHFAADRQIWFAVLEGKLQLIDGQHRLKGVVLAETAAVFQIMLLPVKTQDELHQAYILFDRVGRPRTTNEMLGSLGVATAYGLTKSGAAVVFRAAVLLHYDFRPPHPNGAEGVSMRDDQERLDIAKPWWELGATYESLIKRGPADIRKDLMGTQPVAVALATLKSQPEHAAVFWQGAAMDDGLKRNDPRKALLVWLRSHRVDAKTLNGAAAAALAWNAWYQHRQIETLRAASAERVRIMGTPYGRPVA